MNNGEKYAGETHNHYPKRRKTPSFSYGDIRRVSFAGSMPVKDTIQRR